ncbi:MAG TPA: MauE/DoxX family redox-associated membrane protein [Bacteroidota bacterium]|nr:MauE/DoxX family redox-associated membrane protein [Bacteroidota bacterium]
MSLQAIVRHALRVLIGLLLVAAGVSKVLAFSPFAGVLRPLLGVGGAAALCVAALVIAAEMITGTLMVARRRMQAAASAAFCLFLCFALVLTRAVVGGIDIPCMCFGFIAPRLPLRIEAVLDLLLGLGALACVRDAVSSRGEEVSPRAGGVIPLVSGILWGAMLLSWPVGGHGDRAEVPPRGEFFSGASPQRGDYPAVMLIADFGDFGCQLCLDDFLAFCDSLNGMASRGVPRVRLVARRDTTRTPAGQARLLEGWASGNGYRFPVEVDTDSLFERTAAQKTSAILWGKDGRLIDFARFPLGPARRLELLRALKE